MSHTDLTAWIGNTREVRDHFSSTLLNRIAATFDEPAPCADQALAPLWHWCFFQDAVVESQLGDDGHPARGSFLPPADNRNRMWAGGRIKFIAPLLAEQPAIRRSTVLSAEEKIGSTGALLFVTVGHQYFQDSRLCVEEEQDIVYREATPPKLEGGEAMLVGEWLEQVVPSPTLLFRYSAVTFNGHRIHYDHPYATATEGYPDLVVHGPLIATLSLRAFCRANPLARLRRFSYRGRRPLQASTSFELTGSLVEPGRAELRVGNTSGVAQVATVLFD